MLAEILHMPVEVMKASMTRGEYHGWMLYLSNKQPDSLEIQLATLSTMVAQGLGAKNVSIDDFIIHKPEMHIPDDVVPPDQPTATEQLTGFFGALSVPME